MLLPKSVKKLFASATRRKVLVIFAAVFLALLFVSFAYAADEPANSPFAPSSIVLAIGVFFAQLGLSLVTLLLQFSMFLLQFLIEIAGYNNYLDSPAVQIGWTMVRDVSNMFFVVVLLVIAFGTILGVEQYEWKKMLVKFVFAAVLVNFSQLICGIFIDAAQVVMMTFVNGIAATAGGNLVQAFKLTSMVEYAKSPVANEPESLSEPIGIIGAAIGAILFAAILVSMLAAYLIMLLMRMVTLWVLIVLSPLAFLTSLLPQSQKFASEWWTEFSNNVLSGPVVVFFLWLAFVTVGDGAIHDTVKQGSVAPLDTGEEQQIGDYFQINPSEAKTAGLLGILEWSNMATFIIGIGMLLAGLKVAQRVGGMGTDVLAKGVDIGKKAGAVLSGITTARWAAGKGVEAGKAGIELVGKGAGAAAKAAAWYMPGIGGERISMIAKRQWAGIQSWAKDTGLRVREKRDETGEVIGTEEYIEDKGWMHSFVNRRMAARAVEAKKLEKTENQLKVREEMLDKSVRGEPTHWFQSEDEKSINALDRIEQGVLAKWKERSASKTEEFQARGRIAAGAKGRYYAIGDEKVREGFAAGASVTEQKQRHLVNADIFKAMEQAGATRARKKLIDGELGDVLAKQGGLAALEQEGLQTQEEKNKLEKQEEILKQAGAAGEVLDTIQQRLSILNSVNADNQGQVAKQADLMRELITAVETGNSKDLSAKLEKDTELAGAFNQTFAGQKVSDDFLRKQDTGNLTRMAAVLGNIAKKDSATGRKTTLGEAMAADKAEEKRAQVAVSKDPGWYLARAAAERDEEYLHYRGRRQDAIDFAAQKVIWDKQGIETPNAALKEVIVEGYKKSFSDMNYEQILSNVTGHLDYTAGLDVQIDEASKAGDTAGLSKLKNAKAKSEYVAMALLDKLFDESWIDDAIPIVQTAKFRQFQQTLGADKMNRLNSLMGGAGGLNGATESYERRRERIGSRPITLVAGQIDSMGDLFNDESVKFDKGLMDGIRKGEKQAIDNFFNNFAKNIAASSHFKSTGFGDAGDVVRVLRKVDEEQFKRLLDKIKS